MKTKSILFLLFSIYCINSHAQKWDSYTNIDPKGNGISLISIAIDNAGDKWFATANGTIWKYDNITWTKYINIQDDMGQTTKIVIDKNDNKWIIRNGNLHGGLFKYDNSKWTKYSSLNGLKDDEVMSIALDNNSNVWVITASLDSIHLSKFDGFNWVHYDLSKKFYDAYAHFMAFDSQNNLWVAGNPQLHYVSLWKFDGKTWTEFYPNKDNNSICSLIIDDLGNKWVGTMHGVFKFDGNTWSSLTNINRYVLDIAIDLNGNKWFVTNGGGVYKYDNTSLVNYTTTVGLLNDDVSSVAIDKSGIKWFGTAGGVSVFDESAASSNVMEIDKDFTFLYPNPSNQYVKVKNIDKSTLIIFDIKGSQVLSTQITCYNSIVNVNSLKKGIYYFKFIKPNEIKTVKFIKD